MQIVWFFEKPTIGYCPKCDEIAEYHTGRLKCPECGTQELSLFEWDENSKYPEE